MYYKSLVSHIMSNITYISELYLQLHYTRGKITILEQQIETDHELHIFLKSYDINPILRPKLENTGAVKRQRI